MSRSLQSVFQFLIWMLSLLPSSLLVHLTKIVLLGLNYRKQVINKNYINTKISEDKNNTAEGFYKKNISFIARLIVESIQNTPSDIDKKVQFQNVNKLEALCKDSTGLILLASHYGNWELACSLLPKHTDIPIYGVYKPLKNRWIDQFMTKRRSSHGLILTPMKKIGRTILENRAIGQPAIYILIADQNPNSKNSVIWSPFLGVNTAWFNGPLKLQKKYQFNVAYMEVAVGDTLYNYTVRMHTEELNDSQERLIDSYSALLEKQIEDQPEYWLWSHKRWKRSF